MEQKIIFKTYLYSRKKIICIWLIAGLLFGGIISLIPYLIAGGDFSWAALLIPIGVTAIASPFIYKIYRQMHFWGLINKSKADERSRVKLREFRMLNELLESGIITQEEFDERKKQILWL